MTRLARMKRSPATHPVGAWVWHLSVNDPQSSARLCIAMSRDKGYLQRLSKRIRRSQGPYAKRHILRRLWVAGSGANSNKVTYVRPEVEQ